MTTPTIFSDIAAKPHLQPDNLTGAPQYVPAVLTLEAATPSSTVCGLYRLDRNRRLIDLKFINTDLDDGTTVEFTVGWVYDDAALVSFEDQDGLITTDTGLRTANNVEQWPDNDTGRGAAGINFVALAPGYITITITTGPTTDAGTITCLASFEEGSAPTV